MHSKITCLFPQPALKSGTEAVSKGGSLWRVSWLLLGAHQEVTSKKTNRERAQLCERPATQLAQSSNYSTVRTSKGMVDKTLVYPQKIFSA